MLGTYLLKSCRCDKKKIMPEKGSHSPHRHPLHHALCAVQDEVPLHGVKENDWIGLSFISGPSFLLTPLREIEGILPLTSLTSIPGAKKWICGMTAYHAQAFPVADLSGFLIHKKTKITKDARILVIHTEEGNYGLLVDAILSLHHLRQSPQTEIPALGIAPAYAPYIQGSIRLPTASLPIISCQAIVRSPDFQNIALSQEQI